MTELTQTRFEFDSPEIADGVNTLHSEIQELDLIAQRVEFEKGKRFAAIRDILRHNKRGGFEAWLGFEGIASKTAYNYIKVFDVFGNSVTVTELLPAKVLYLLASPSTPESARLEAIERAGIGEKITYTKAVEIVREYKEPTLPETFGRVEITPAIEKFQEVFSDSFSPEKMSWPPAPVPIEFRQPQPMALLTSSKNDSWRTPSRYIEAARLVMGSIDLDPASSEIANETIKATSIFTKDNNGLDKNWFGNVWLNPPYGKTNNLSNQGLFAHKLVTEYNAGRVAQGILLVNLYVGYGWVAPLRELPKCEVDHRISFIDPETDEEGDEAKASSVFIYVGSNPSKFFSVFKQFGACGQLSYNW